MKKIILGIFVVLMFAQLCVSSYAQEGKLVRITLISQEPDPATPGEYVDLRFKIENLGDDFLEIGRI